MAFIKSGLYELSKTPQNSLFPIGLDETVSDFYFDMLTSREIRYLDAHISSFFYVVASGDVGLAPFDDARLNQQPWSVAYCGHRLAAIMEFADQ